MSEHFENFGIDPFRRGNVYSGKPASAESFLQGIPPELLKLYTEFIEGKGVRGIMKKLSESEKFRRKRLRAGLGKKFGRRFGPRSGAAVNQIADRVTAQSFGRLSELEGGLLQRGQEFGATGIQSLLRFFQDQFALEEQGSPGFLDFVGPAIDIGSIAAAPFTGGTSLAIPAARRQLNNPRGPT